MQGTRHRAFHRTVFGRWLVLVALETTARFYTSLGFCMLITRNKIVKTGPFVHLTEGATIEFIAQDTSIQSPAYTARFFTTTALILSREGLEKAKYQREQIVGIVGLIDWDMSRATLGPLSRKVPATSILPLMGIRTWPGLWRCTRKNGRCTLPTPT